MILLLNAAVILFVTGVSWFVQVAHYPLFGAVGLDAFAKSEARHTNQATRVVLGPMVVELATRVLLIWQRPPLLGAWGVWLSIGLVGLIWSSTALLQRPRHRELARGFDAAAHKALVTMNGLRTAAWTVRSRLVRWWLAKVMQ